MDQVRAGQPPADFHSPSGESERVEREAQFLDTSEINIAVDEGEHDSEEAERQRLERLGRERPAKLKSFGSEILFCYSVIASQFMAVSYRGG